MTAAEAAVAWASRLLEVAFACASPVHRALPPAGVDRACRARRSNEGAKDSRAPPRAFDPSPAGQPTAVRTARPSAVSGVQPDVAARLVERLLGAAGDAPPRAAQAGRPPLDLSASKSRTADDLL